MSTPNVCLSIIAKGPREPLLRAIGSALPFVQHIVVVVAPGDPLSWLRLPTLRGNIDIVEYPWEGHAKTRTRAFHYARAYGEWILVLDAHSQIEGYMPDLNDPEADAYEIDVEDPISRWRWARPGHLVRSDINVAYEGVIHETLKLREGACIKRHRGLVVRGTATDKAPGTYLDQAKLLRAELEENPHNPRALFYYAQSLKDGGDFLGAFNAYDRRARAGGWEEEVFWSLMWRAMIAHNKHVPYEPYALYLKAHEHSPKRAEPIVHLQRLAAARGQMDDAMRWGKLAVECPYPVDARLFIDTSAYSPKAKRAAGVSVEYR